MLHKRAGEHLNLC